MRLKEDTFGWENIMAGIFEYILGPSMWWNEAVCWIWQKLYLYFGMDRSA